MNPKQEMKKAMEGVRYFHEGKYERVKQVALSLLRNNPRQPMALMLMGYYAHVNERWDEAIEYYKRSLKAKPKLVPGLIALGNAYRVTGKYIEALSAYQEVLKIDPQKPDVLISVAQTQYALGDLEKSAQSANLALQNNPNIALAYRILARISKDRNESVDKTIAYCQKAIELDPVQVDAYTDLGNYLLRSGNPVAACNAYTAILQKNVPDTAQIFSNWLFALHNLDNIDREELFKCHLQWLARHKKSDRKKRVDFTNTPDANRKLRVGFTSPDFYGHSIFFFLNSLFSSYDREQFTFICFSDTPKAKEDRRTHILEEHVDAFYRTKDLSVTRLNALVEQNCIDILIDLTGHTGSNRLLSYMQRCSPVQVTWLGYPDTTGLDTMDYRIVDNITDPTPWADELASEDLYRIPAPFLCFKPVDEWLSLKTREELQPGKIVFGSFNNASKLSPSTINVWCEILKRIPEAELVIKCRKFAKEKTHNFLSSKFREVGIDESRLRMLDFLPSSTDHMNTYNEMDVALDTFPYNGTTTSFQALWMGVPLITTAGDRHCARVGMSLLKSLGMDEFIANSDEEYIQKAVEIANEREKLLEIKRSLRNKMLSSPLCDSVGFTAKFEAALRDMWKQWCLERNRA